VLATKYTTNFRAGRGESEIMVNNTGNGAKSLHVSVNASLRKLQTDYIDLVSQPSYETSLSNPQLRTLLTML
jgi:aryl-alcohol dehydrogenase-like predicted oxidoreductase